MASCPKTVRHAPQYFPAAIGDRRYCVPEELPFGIGRSHNQYSRGLSRFLAMRLLASLFPYFATALTSCFL
jgi:hypothetical protein